MIDADMRACGLEAIGEGLKATIDWYITIKK